ncbi:hypothetical protein RCL1_006974 [Eukaryota sp. TZLM3-RCL]
MSVDGGRSFMGSHYAPLPSVVGIPTFNSIGDVVAGSHVFFYGLFRPMIPCIGFVHIFPPCLLKIKRCDFFLLRIKRCDFRNFYDFIVLNAFFATCVTFVFVYFNVKISNHQKIVVESHHPFDLIVLNAFFATVVFVYFNVKISWGSKDFSSYLDDDEPELNHGPLFISSLYHFLLNKFFPFLVVTFNLWKKDLTVDGDIHSNPGPEHLYTALGSEWLNDATIVNFLSTLESLNIGFIDPAVIVTLLDDWDLPSNHLKTFRNNICCIPVNDKTRGGGGIHWSLLIFIQYKRIR